MTRRKAYVFGSGGHARVIASMLDCDVTFVVPEKAGDATIAEADFMARLDDMRGADIYIGIGDNDLRQRIFKKLETADLDLPACVAPGVFIARDAAIGRGAVVCPGAVIGSCAVLGDNTIVNSLSSVDHDCALGDHSQVTAGVTLGGTVRIGERCFLGVKSAVIPNIAIGDDVIVMAGSLITKPVGSSVLVGGSPARVLKEL